MYSTDQGLSFTEVPMDSIGGNTYSGEIPGQIPGSEIFYFAKAIDIDGREWKSGQYSYKIFKKENDNLFIYNGSDFGQGTASFFYIGDGTAESLAHDFWSVSNDGVAELDVLLALYDNVLQIDGSFPDADVSANIAAWIATGTAGNPKAYLQSSQDFGCFISGCADITFVPGDFMYDIMGVETLGPQDFSGGSNADMQIVGVDADPNSGWVNTYAAANGVDFWYNPAAELGFTNWIDNIVPAPGATTIFTEPSTGNFIGVTNQGTGWYTSFLAFDYLGANFLSDTSITPLFDDPKYAWGISVASQAFQFFTWTGVVSVEHENNLLPDEYSLSQNYPNPFNPSTNIQYAVSSRQFVSLKVYDVLGKEVATLVNEEKPAGEHEVEFQSAVGGRQLASGIYFYQLKAGSFVQTKKMIFLK
ncbi:MAG: T9SS type A sorting domain-containing protein [Bacteroidetes bacterium]|nr:T9SS type A sorting domain-containing protein [Bacteroidota bacterium]